MQIGRGEGLKQQYDEMLSKRTDAQEAVNLAYTKWNKQFPKPTLLIGAETLLNYYDVELANLVKRINVSDRRIASRFGRAVLRQLHL